MKTTPDIFQDIKSKSSRKEKLKIMIVDDTPFNIEII
jgi:hypothetical protein